MVWSRVWKVLLLALLSTPAIAQVNRYMVTFKDKTGTPYSVNNAIEFLSQKAIDRRIRQGIPITEQDIPVNAAYLAAVKGTGAETFFQTRWLNGVLVQCDATIVPEIEELPSVASVTLVAPNSKLISNGRKKSPVKAKSSKTTDATKSQLELIGLDAMQREGYKGEGITIAILDAGFPGVNSALPFQDVFTDNRVDLTLSHDFVFNSDDVFQYDTHGTHVFSVIAAWQAGVFTGGAYQANYQLYITEDVSSEYRIEEYNWLFAAERADSAGADVISSSLGYYDFDDASMNYSAAAMDGKTAVVSRAAQWAADRGIVVVVSAGNEGATGWKIITAPADAADVLAIANVNSNGVRAATSSMGPSADGRIKPDVAAMGTSTVVVTQSGALGTSSGTSLAAPLITSLVAGVWQSHPELTNLQVIEAIRNSASQASHPDNLIGYGIPDFTAVENYLSRHSQENAFEVFPNPPITDTITIRPFDPSVVSFCQVEVVSSLGQIIGQHEANFSWINPEFVMDISELKAGVYFIRIAWGDKRYTSKILKSNP